MYTYKKRNRLGAGSIFFMVLFIVCTIGLAIMLYIDKGKFWDILPFASIPILAISLILIIFNFVKRSGAGYIFIFFFLIFLCGFVLSSVFGPFAINRKAQKSFTGEKYKDSINQYSLLLENYPNSRYAAGVLKNISFAYYKSGRYIEAVESYDDSLEQGLISYDDLEIQKIYAESYEKIAENNYNDKSYLLSAEYYLKTADVLENLISNYPDVNEAFIATHKIPGLLFNAALSYQKMEDYEQEIKVFEDLLENHSDSDYSPEASLLIFNAYINNAIRLVTEAKYSEGLEELLKTFDIEDENEELVIFDYKKVKIFHDVPIPTTKNTAHNLFRAREYEKALFLYEALVEYYPEAGSGITGNLVRSKLSLVVDTDYTKLEQSTPERYINSPGKSIIIIENNTPYSITFYLGGPENKLITVFTESGSEIELTPGDYEIAVQSADSSILPYYGIITYEENRQYREVYNVPEE